MSKLLCRILERTWRHFSKSFFCSGRIFVILKSKVSVNSKSTSEDRISILTSDANQNWSSVVGMYNFSGCPRS